MLRQITIASAGLLLLVGCASLPARPQSTGHEPAAIAASPGLVSAADPRAAEAGAAMLRAGGSATDAAIATMLALTVVEPQSSGIGGGGFFVHGSASGNIETLDGRETAPAAAMPEWFLQADGRPRPYMEAVLSGLSVGVPGNIALAAEAHRRHGKLDWAALFSPAIALAGDGFVITERFREFLLRSRDRAGADAAGLALFYDAAREPLPTGTSVKNPALAETLASIAEYGPEWFYGAAHAAVIAAQVSAATPHPAGMTVADIAGYDAKERPALCGDYRSFRICGMGPPSSGATTVFAILKQLEHFDLAALGPDSPESWHLFAESQRLAYADRELYLADSDFVSVPVAGLMEADYLAERGALISLSSRMSSVSAGVPNGVTARWSDGAEPVENGTSHFVAVDRDGNAVSYTSTVEGSFGSGIMVGGYYLNNELTDFSFIPEQDGLTVANRVEGGKRPRSSMSPTIVFNAAGEPVLAIGAAGGSTIPVQVAKALIGVLDWGLGAQAAIALPGLFSPGDTITLEPGSSLLAIKPRLEALGHNVTERGMPFKANAAQRVNGRWIGAADPRSEGAAIGE